MNLKKLSDQKMTPDNFIAVIEIPMGSNIKYELDKDTETIFVDRFAFTSMGYPLNYGFIPGTMADDGDPVDVLVLTSTPISPGCAIKCRVIGILVMEDEEGMDEKLLAVPLPKVDAFSAHIQSLDDVPEAMKNKIKHFFERYKELEPGKWVKVKDWKSREEAAKYLEKALK
ncbi:MAG: Inorganic pyrophosphatase [Microgenomates group bacterium GW2011_GWC1_41_8]|uniref:Inorganic pyrophosphatase n=3 Tax=Candidatus Roizmaniibacteriota TaxID=1752723 RepID=A0A0G0X818_9BACT|nr:MAG: Inorganic pyrophosphatase [Candidatus Levybacteria bacterium GW2011_GWA2_40_16]KKR72036.1 MAG: Inorganic pyrophosphatase [Candidatus Roizmanbacteria bacterium GW2011_GWB1_40_7]KKR94399.1 MAG: Inorganic pyrophosphatase [Candidatus Roizmanbacteria bacterium GW2011_GWA1_41_13]KKS21080.1 MAG: Inorganic pyrophosphatase [Candidatus Roizmanbacteria bacterium GW2011_GWC2_41_7]KKS22191.1 MAG: Inorganic pyrophosphatase [Microgenomates group bacterium GW2011_GWC1_41_8]OGK47935.1 MAG: inorganic py